MRQMGREMRYLSFTTNEYISIIHVPHLPSATRIIPSMAQAKDRDLVDSQKFIPNG